MKLNGELFVVTAPCVKGPQHSPPPTNPPYPDVSVMPPSVLMQRPTTVWPQKDGCCSGFWKCETIACGSAGCLVFFYKV